MLAFTLGPLLYVLSLSPDLKVYEGKTMSYVYSVMVSSIGLDTKEILYQLINQSINWFIGDELEE